MKQLKKICFFLLLIGIIVSACKKGKNEPDPTVPTLTTTALTNITPTTATGGGTITGDGGEAIRASGLVYSSTNNMPTLSDSKVTATATSGTFTAELTGLSSGKNYYLRAYATNSIGTGYGDVMTFSTGNTGPEAKSIKITGDKNVGTVLTATYTYFDAENNPQAGTTFQWYVANDSIGAAETVIAGATSLTFTLTDAQKDRFIRLGITPRASAGTSPGVEAKSYWLGPIGGEVVTFTYNGAQVTYGVITSSVTGRKWMDRNLGAKQVATAFNDYLAFGDLFQWGRGADGHQLVIWNNCCTAGDGRGVNGTTTALSSKDAPGHNLFILTSGQPYNWREFKNDNLWQGLNGINNPCPVGWRVSTKDDFEAEIVNGYIGLGHLFMTGCGYRRTSDDGSILTGGSVGAGNSGYYWSSSIDFSDPFAIDAATMFRFRSNSDPTSQNNFTRGAGGAIRCIKHN